MFSFEAPFCSVSEPARAPWWLSADWPIDLRAGASALAGVRASGLSLAGFLLRSVHVRCSRVRGRDVGLRDVPVVARAQHPNRDVAVRRVLLDGPGECRCALLVVSRLTGDLASASTGLVLVGRLRGPVQVAGRRVRGRDVRLRDRAVVTGAEDAHRDVLVGRAALLRQRGCIRLLSVVSGLTDRLQVGRRALAAIGREPAAVTPASAGVRARSLVLTGRLRRPVHVRSSRVRRGLVRLRHRTVVARAQDPDGDVLVRRALLDGCGECRRVLIVACRLPGDLAAAAAAAGSGLGLAGRLLGRVRVACRRVGRCGVRLRDVSVVAVALHANRSVLVRRALLGRRGECERVLRVRRRLACCLEACASGLPLIGRLRAAVLVRSRAVRRGRVRLVTAWYLLRCPDEDPCGRVRARWL